MRKMTWLIVFTFIPVVFAHAEVSLEDAVGVWLLNEGSGDVAMDSSGNGNDGVLEGVEWADGISGKGLSFDDIGSVEIASTGDLQLGDQITLMAYFYAEALDDWHQLIAKDGEYLLRIDPPSEGGAMSTFMNLDGGWEPRASASVAEMNTWTHFAAVYDGLGSTLTVYVNGVFVGEVERIGNSNPGDAPVTIGHWNEGNNFVGTIDEVAIFDVALAEEDILNIVTNGLAVILSEATAVKPSGKLSITWGDLKE